MRFINRYLSIAILFCYMGACAQQPNLADSSAQHYTDSLGKAYPPLNKLFLAGLKTKTSDRKLLKHYETTYTAVFKTLNEKIDAGEMIYIPEVAEMTDKIIAEIKHHNPSVPRDIRVLVIRENVPNAYTMGDNTLFVHLGLFYYLENEDQVASILAHEIGHGLLMHSIKALTYNYETDKESAEKVKTVKRTEIKRTDRALDIVRNSIYKRYEIGRLHEMEADSLGYILLKNTGYRPTSFIEALEIIDKNDTIVHSDLGIETYKLFFDLPEQPFSETWLATEDFSSYNYASYKPKFDEDSVSSHPKFEERINHLKSTFPELAKQENTPATTVPGTYKAIRLRAEQERVPNLYFNERYGEALYLSLLYLQKNPGDKAHRLWLAKNLQKIYEARRDYQLNKYLDRVAAGEQPESYVRFLNFMWNLKLDEMKIIAEHYPVKD